MKSTVALESTGNVVVAGNFIGTDAESGMTAISNGSPGVYAADGVMIDSGASGNTIGGMVPSARNVISGNELNGVEIIGTTTANNTADNLVEDNYIGTNVSGTESLPNGDKDDDDGRRRRDRAAAVRYNTIGGHRFLWHKNVISGNISCGVEIDSSSGGAPSSNLVEGNDIGTDFRRGNPVPNGADGVRILSSSSNTIGGTYSLPGNVIAFNGGNGVTVGVTASEQQAPPVIPSRRTRSSATCAWGSIWATMA